MTDPKPGDGPASAPEADEKPLRIFLSAGEESGDRHGADLVSAILKAEPKALIRGMGGRRMAAAGCEIVADPTSMAVMWFADVFRNLPAFIRLFDDVVSAVAGFEPDVVVPIDYPGFNLRLAERARGMCFPVVYYIAPQVWAWWRSRIYRFCGAVDRMLVIFPFEREMWMEAGIRADYVGHPAAERLGSHVPDRAAIAALAGDPANLVALLPGSRKSEVRRNLPLMLETAVLLRRDRPELAFRSAFTRPVLSEIAREIGKGFDLPYAVLDDKPEPGASRVLDLMALSRAAVVCAGTATVELAILGTPMVVVYKIAPHAMLLNLAMNRSPHIAMANLLAGRRAFPEFLTCRMKAEPIAAAVRGILRDGPARDAQIAALGKVRSALGGPGASARAARIVLDTAREFRNARAHP